jgi:hypothetical protein
MKSVIQSTAVLCGVFMAAGLGLAPVTAFAANAGAPYTNVDPRNDRGNNTGDSQVEGLNERQLDQNYWREAQHPGGVPNAPYYTPR